MTMSIHTILTTTLLLCLAWPINSRASLSIPEEPGEEFLIEQSYDTIVGLFIRAYSLRQNGEVDYRTARQILALSYDDPASAALDVASNPIFYWYDPNQDGQWEMWVDRDGLGHPADLVRYNWKPGSETNVSSNVWK